MAIYQYAPPRGRRRQRARAGAIVAPIPAAAMRRGARAIPRPPAAPNLRRLQRQYKSRKRTRRRNRYISNKTNQFITRSGVPNTRKYRTYARRKAVYAHRKKMLRRFNRKTKSIIKSRRKKFEASIRSFKTKRKDMAHKRKLAQINSLHSYKKYRKDHRLQKLRPRWMA